MSFKESSCILFQIWNKVHIAYYIHASIDYSMISICNIVVVVAGRLLTLIRCVTA